MTLAAHEKYTSFLAIQSLVISKEVREEQNDAQDHNGEGTAGLPPRIDI